MISEAILICALALPPVDHAKEFKMLCEFIHHIRPRAQIILVKDFELPEKDFEKIPFTLHGYQVYVRRSA